MRNSVFLMGIIVCAAVAAPLYSAGFFEIVYAPSTIQDKDFEDGLQNAPSFGILFGYETEIMATDVLFDLELGYEVSTHELKKPLDDPDYYFRNHRGILGMRVKYGGMKWVEPYIGIGSVVYAFYDNSDDLGEAPPGPNVPNFEIVSNFSGLYMVVGVDFFFSRKGNYSFGIEYRNMNYKVEDTDSGATELDARVRRLAFKFSALF